jgi:hypothetical protein
MPKFLYAMAAALVLWSRVAHARPPPVVVELEQDTPEIDGTELRDAVARELDAPVVSEAGPEIEAVRMVVRIDRARGELQVEREGTPGEAIVRRVPLPAEPSEALRTAVFLIGNLARDEAGTLIHDLHAREATAPAAPEPAPVPSAAATVRKRLWIGASVEGDVAFVSSASDVCLLTSRGLSLTAYRCTDGGNPFPSNIAIDNEIRRGVDDQVQSGLSLANARFLVSVDAALDDHWLLGGRLGVATATYPVHGATDAPATQVDAFGKLHVEARVTYVIGEHPLATAALAPVLVLGTGLAEHSTAVSVKVSVTVPTAGSNATTSTGSVSAWRVAGPGFVSTGIGLRWTVSPGFALSILPKATLAFGSGSPMALLSPEVVGQVGF